MKSWKNFAANKLKKYCIIWSILCIFAELFIFNYKAFLIHPLNASAYKEQTFAVKYAECSGLYFSETDGFYHVTESHPTIIFSMKSPIKTMFFDASLTAFDGHEFVADIAYATESYSDYHTSAKSFSIVNTLPDSQYVTCSYFGNVTKIKLILNVEPDTSLRLGNFIINKKIPMNFSMFRVLFIFLLGALFYIFMKYPPYSLKYHMGNRSHKYATRFVFVAFIVFLCLVYSMYVRDIDWFDKTDGNQMTQELVDAFEAGQVSLTDEVPQSLVDLENPYDWSARSQNNVPAKWDHLLFEGKYYSYYGIAPVLILFLPYHMITGYYFSASLACLLFALLATVFLGLCYLKIVKNWFSNAPFRLVILGLIMTLFSSYIFLDIIGCNFYEIAQTSSMCFLVIGFYWMLSGGIFTKGKIRPGYLFLSALFVSLSVLSRATSALYAVVMVIWLFYGFFQYMKEQKRKFCAAVRYIILSISPYVFFGLVQISYNYYRFGNPFDLGIQYSLTINDFTRTEMHLGQVMISIVNFLFAIPIINSKFPFVHDNFDNLSVNGYYFVATRPAIGIIPTYLPILSLLYVPKYRKLWSAKQKLKLFLIWFLPGVIIPITLIGATWESGYAMRYNADFAWQMVLAGFVFIFFTYGKLNNKVVKKWLLRMLLVSATWCVVVSVSIIFSTNPIDAVAHSRDGAKVYYELRSLIAFW